MTFLDKWRQCFRCSLKTRLESTTTYHRQCPLSMFFVSTDHKKR